MVIQEIKSAHPNLIPDFKTNGKTIKKTKEGRTAQKIPQDKSIIF